MSTKNLKTILLVEDEIVNATITAKIIKSFGFNVNIANTGEEAIDTFKNNNTIDLILMDIDLGSGIDGTEAAAIILKDHDVPVVFLSSHTEPEIVEKTEKITSYGYVVKGSGSTVLDASIKMAFKLFEALKNERKKEQALRKSQHDLIGSQRLAHLGSWHLDIATNDVFWTEELYKMYGFDPALPPPPYTEHMKLFTPESWEALSSALVKTRETGFPYELELKTVRKDGCNGWMWVRGEAVFDADGKTIGLWGAAQDITERKLIEIKLDETQAILKAAMDQSTAGIAIANADGSLRYVNDAGLLIRGGNREEVVNGVGINKYVSNWKLLDLDGLPLKTEEVPLARAVMYGETNHREFIIRRDNDEDRVVMANAAPIKNADDKVVAAVVVFIDITERKNSEEKLIETKALLDTVIENVPHMIFLKEATDLRFVMFNRAGEELVGYDRKAFLGKNDLDFFPPEQAAHFMAKDRVVLDGEISLLDIPEEPILTAGKGQRLLHTQKVCIRGIDGKTKYLLGISEDITERRQAEEKIKNLLTEKEILLKEVYHRIKNNMNTVASIMSLQMDTLKEPSAIAALNDARSRVVSMMLLYDKLYRTDNLKELSFKKYISPLVDEIIGNFPNRTIVKIEKNIESFMVDTQKTSHLGIIINELLTNIMKYAFAGRAAGLITISASTNNNHATIIVQDNGIGIPESIDITNSSGFGLQLVEMMTKQLRGTIKIERNNGTKFILEFNL